MALEPTDSRAQSFFERDSWLPFQELARLGVVREQTLDFTLFGADARRVWIHQRLGAEQFADEGDQVADGDLGASSKVEAAADGLGRIHGGDHSRDGVTDVGEIAGRRERAEFWIQLGQDLYDDRRNHRSCGLPGPIRIKRAHSDGGHVERPRVAFNQFVGGDLTGGIRRLRLKGMLFVYGHVPSGTEDFAAGSVHESAHAMPQASVEYVLCPAHIHLSHFGGSDVGVGNADDRAKVKDILGRFDKTIHGVWIAEIALDNLHGSPQFQRGVFEPAVGSTAVVANEGPEGCALTDQLLAQVAADKAPGAGD